MIEKLSKLNQIPNVTVQNESDLAEGNSNIKSDSDTNDEFKKVLDKTFIDNSQHFNISKRIFTTAQLKNRRENSKCSIKKKEKLQKIIL